MNSITNPNDAYRFLFTNRSTFTGKCTIKDWNTVGNHLKYALALTLKHQ